MKERQITDAIDVSFATADEIQGSVHPSSLHATSGRYRDDPGNVWGTLDCNYCINGPQNCGKDCGGFFRDGDRLIQYDNKVWKVFIGEHKGLHPADIPFMLK